MKKHLLIAAALIAASGSASLATNYQIAWTSSWQGSSVAINDSGQIAGRASSASGAAVYQNGTQTIIGPGTPFDINNNGLVVGQNTLLNRACYWQNGVSVDLGSLFGSSGLSQATAVNDSGLIVGASWTDPYKQKPTAWYNGSIIDLGVLPGFSGGNARGVNNNGDIVGQCWNSTRTIYHLCLWKDGIIQDLGAVSGDSYKCYANGINDNGQIIGQSESFTYSSTGYRAWIWQNGVVTDLGVGGAFGINNQGQVVGWMYNSTLKRQDACIWENGVQSALPGYSGNATIAWAINNNSQVVGSLQNSNCGVLWNPVPEPSSILGLVGGLAGMVGMLRRRN